MSNPDKSIDPRILESAREEFLSKPYEQVSLREICQKAGVTTGAFYNRYKNVEQEKCIMTVGVYHTVCGCFSDRVGNRPDPSGIFCLLSNYCRNTLYGYSGKEF